MTPARGPAVAPEGSLTLLVEGRTDTPSIGVVPPDDSDQAGLLRSLGCDRGQGYYYCRPLPAAALTALFKEHISEETEPLEWLEGLRS